MCIPSICVTHDIRLIARVEFISLISIWCIRLWECICAVFIQCYCNLFWLLNTWNWAKTKKKEEEKILRVILIVLIAHFDRSSRSDKLSNRERFFVHIFCYLFHSSYCTIGSKCRRLFVRINPFHHKLFSLRMSLISIHLFFLIFLFRLTLFFSLSFKSTDHNIAYTNFLFKWYINYID